MIEWFEELPEQCPPKDANNPEGMTVYRFSHNEMPHEADFISQRMIQPERLFNGVDECTARSLSVFDNLETCQNKMKLPRMRKRFSSIIEVRLENKDGLIKKTFNDPNHYSWWRSNGFNFKNTIIAE